MNFNMGSIEEAKVAAQQADNVGGSYVTEPGAYPGKITKAYFHKFSSGAGGLKIEADVEKDGEKKLLSVLIITVGKNQKDEDGNIIPDSGFSYYIKDGKRYPFLGMNQIQGGLMPIANKRNMQAVKNAKGEITYPCLEGVDMGFLVNIKITDNNKNPGQTFKNVELVAFYDPKTNRTGSEILNNTEAKKKVKIEAGLKVIDESTKQQPAGPDPFEDDDSNESDSPFAKKEKDIFYSEDTTELEGESNSEDYWNQTE